MTFTAAGTATMPAWVSAFNSLTKRVAELEAEIQVLKVKLEK